LSYAELNPSNTIAARVNIFSQFFIYFSWLSLNFTYHWGVVYEQMPLYQLMCNTKGVGPMFCTLLKGVAYCSSAHNILSGFATLYSVYQLVRAYREDRHIKPLALFDVLTLVCISLILSGYIVWTIAGMQLITDKSGNGTATDLFPALAHNNKAWVRNWYNSFPMHAAVAAMISTSAYSIQNPNRFSVVAASIASVIATIDVVPMFVCMTIAQLKAFGNVCTPATYSDYKCSTRVALIGGIGIVNCASLLLTLVVGCKFIFMPIVGTVVKTSGASDYTSFQAGTTSEYVGLDEKAKGGKAIHISSPQQDTYNYGTHTRYGSSTTNGNGNTTPYKENGEEAEIPEYSPYVSVRYPGQSTPTQVM